MKRIVIGFVQPMRMNKFTSHGPRIFKIRVFDRLTLQTECIEETSHLFPYSFIQYVPSKVSSEIAEEVFLRAREDGSFCYYDAFFLVRKVRSLWRW